ncbi:MAG: tetratricopeptide repeat protein, partial [Planctomycetota bacterium]
MFRRLFTLLAVLLIAPTAWSCIWDKDTLDDERRGVPEGYRLVVTDRWHRHGEAYYRKRIETLPAHLEKNPGDLGAYDDLAVAHERFGDQDSAIEVMDRKAVQLEKTPDKDHLYRMHANRGTFHAHAGRFDEALKELDKAIEINPDAHFGREIYQVLAIRYVAAAKKDPSLWSKRNLLSWNGIEFHGLTNSSFSATYRDKDSLAPDA